MTETSIMAGICTFQFPYPIEKIEDFPYPYLYPNNAKILRQNRDRFR